MPKKRIYELAKDLGVESKTVLQILRDHGSLVRSASSTLEPDDVVYVRQAVLPRVHRRGRVPEPLQHSRDKVLSLHSMSSSRDRLAVLRACRRAVESDRHDRLVIDLEDAEGFYPSACVPIAATVQHFRAAGLPVQFVNVPPLADKMSIRNPLEANPATLRDEGEVLSRVWAYFDDRQSNALTTAFVDAVRRKVLCEAGVLEALEWCLYEVLDNVTQHAESDAGYTMMQVHARSKRLVVSVADTGRGVRRSLSSSTRHRPRSDFDALTMAIKEGVTRDTKTNQGNGLFGLLKMVEQNGGTLELQSGNGFMELSGDRFVGDNKRQSIASENAGLSVDFKLSVNRPVSIGEALNYNHVDDFMEGLENDQGEHVLVIRDQAGGAGSRAAARELRNLIQNILTAGADCIVLDFSGQAVVSSSFADEVIGKLFAELGAVGFNRHLRLVHMTPTVETLINRAITKRVTKPAG